MRRLRQLNISAFKKGEHQGTLPSGRHTTRHVPPRVESVFIRRKTVGFAAMKLSRDNL